MNFRYKLRHKQEELKLTNKMESEVQNPLDLAILKQQMSRNIIDFAEFQNMVMRNLSGIETIFKNIQISIIEQAYSKFCDEMTIEAFVRCIEEQVSLQDKPEMYVGLVLMSKDFLLEQTK